MVVCAPGPTRAQPLADAVAGQTALQPPQVPSRGPGFDLAEHPRLVFGRALTLDFQGKLDFDGMAFPIDERGHPSYEVARHRLGVSATLFDRLSFELESELVGDHPWRDVVLTAQVTESLAVRAGKFKVPFSLAQTTSSLKLDFVHRPLAAEALAPGRQVGVTVEGALLSNGLRYQGGVFREGEEEWDDGPMAAARLVARPFRHRVEGLDALSFGVAATHGERPQGLTSVAGRTFTDRLWFFPEVYVNGRRLRTGYELAWSGGPITLAGEYMRVADERRDQGLRGEDLPDLVAHGWYVSGTWMMVGSRRADRLPLAPAPLVGDVGGLELALRFEGLRFSSDAAAEPAFRNPRAAHVLGNADVAMTLGVNWFFSRFGRLQGNLIGERVTDAFRSPVGSADRFWSTVARLQLHF